MICPWHGRSLSELAKAKAGSSHSDSDGMRSIPAFPGPNAWNVPLLLCHEQLNEASLPVLDMNQLSQLEYEDKELWSGMCTSEVLVTVESTPHLLHICSYLATQFTPPQMFSLFSPTVKFLCMFCYSDFEACCLQKIQPRYLLFYFPPPSCCFFITSAASSAFNAHSLSVRVHFCGTTNDSCNLTLCRRESRWLPAEQSQRTTAPSWLHLILGTMTGDNFTPGMLANLN